MYHRVIVSTINFTYDVVINKSNSHDRLSWDTGNTSRIFVLAVGNEKF